MGANAQTSVPTFTAGDVLTAANMNISARTGVPVFANTTDRDAAFGGTGEKTLAEGQLCYVENLTGDAQIQYYDGSTWTSLGAAGLTLITAQTVGTAVSSVTVSNVFSSTYDNYRVIYTGGSGSGAIELWLTFGATTTNYQWNILTSAWNNTLTTVGATGAARIQSFRSSTTSNNTVFDVLSPNLTEHTTVWGMSLENGQWNMVTGLLADTTAYTAFTLTTGSGTITGGTIRVYGYRN